MPKHRPGRSGQFAARAIAPVEGQVHGPERLSEPFSLRVQGHPPSVPASGFIVNPDESTRPADR
jgi:hypothetical protein